MMRVLLADDEPLALKRLEVAFKDIRDARVVATAINGDEALHMIREHAPDVVVLDIDMPWLDGMSVARALEPETRPHILFVTAHDRFAAEAFGVDAVDYLLKPVRFDRLKLALDRVAARRRSAARAAIEPRPRTAVAPRSSGYLEFVWVRGPRGLRRVELKDIQWIEAARDYVLLHIGDEQLAFQATMSQLQTKIDPASMVRVHRSHIVRRTDIRAVQRQPKGACSLVLANGRQLPVGPKYADRVSALAGSSPEMLRTRRRVIHGLA